MSALALLVGMTACSSGSGSGNGGGADKGAAKKTVYLISSVGTGWQSGYNAQFVKTLQAKGVKVTHLQDPFDVQQNVSNLNQAIAAHPGAIALMSIDNNAVLPSLVKAKKLGVPVINLDGRLNAQGADLVTSSLEANNGQLGDFAARNVVAGLQAEGRKTGNIIAITGTAATNTVQDRITAFKAYLAKFPQYKLVAVEDGQWDQTKTAQIAQTLFAKYRSSGGVQAAYGMADNQAAGIIQAAQQANVPVGVAKKGLIVTGSNCYKIGITSVQAGVQYGTATQAPGVEAAWAAGWVDEFINGKTIPHTLQQNEAQVTPQTVSKYAAQCSSA